MKEFVEHNIFQIIASVSAEIGHKSYVIGGYVRDKILNRKDPKDIDIVTDKDGIELAQAVARRIGKVKVNIFKTYGTAQIKTKEWELEFVGARKESYGPDSRNPRVIPGTLQDDQERRDFTVNALAISLNVEDFGSLVDPFGGLEDLEKGILRTPLDPGVTYSDDPLRMMRAIRFATQLNFSIEKKSLEAISTHSERLSIITAERIKDEFNKIMLAPRPSTGLHLLFETGLLQQFIPELCALQGVEEIEGKLHKDNFHHTLEVVDNISLTTDKLWLRYAALLHDIGKSITKSFVEGTGWTFHNHEFVGSKKVHRIFRRMKLPLGEPLRYVEKLIRLSSRPIAIGNKESTDSAARRLLFEAGDDIEDLMLLCEADITTKNEKKKKKYLHNFQQVREKLKEVEEKDHIRNFQPPISGEEIMRTFDLKPGREIGTLKEAIKEAILEGTIRNTYEDAFDFMLKMGREMGLEEIKRN